MWGYSPTNRTSIDEANKHLAAMVERITELETTVKEQQLALLQKDESTHMQLTEIKREKDKDIKKMSRELKETEKLLTQAEDSCREKDSLIVRLTEKSNILSEMVKCKPQLDKLAHCLNQAAKITANDSDEEKNKSRRPQTVNHFPNKNSMKPKHSMKAAHSMINLSSGQSFPRSSSPTQFQNGLSPQREYLNGGLNMSNGGLNMSTGNREIKDRLAKSLLSGSTYDLSDQDYINSAVSYESDSPSHQSKELYL